MQQPPQGFLVAAGMPPSQGSGCLVSAEVARARAAEQMAFEDAWKALNPDFRTPFASVEDAVSRLLPYHVFADCEEDDDVVEPINGGSSSISTTTEKSSTQIWDDDMGAQVEGFLEHFEKQVLTFNVMTQQHAAGFNRTEEQLILEKAVVEDERLQLERVRAAVTQRQQQEQQEAARTRLALAQAQAQAAGGGWQAAQPAASWQAFVAAGLGEGAGSRGQALAPAVVMQQQQHNQQQEMMMTAGAWQALAAAVSRGEGGSNEQALIHAVMVQHMQRQRQQEEMMVAASRGEGASCGQVLPPAMVTQLMQQHNQNQQRQQEEMMTAAFRGEVTSGEQQALASAVMMRQLHVLQQQQHQQEVMAAGGWQLGLGGRQTHVAPRGDGSSSFQAALPPAMLQLQQPGSGQGQASIAGSGMALPWHGIAEGREQ
ncbi:unnamed protein product [Miscanthus lutarioriparius]|uniref:GLTSCR protein conserved domain-containing protein n=1 Tax=Miscanthus lutarioriparius TaxID=422564 RepID=A0A811R2N4_9POAL|nr:unnamed protein product [Miscanthus lutarioriparius]